MSRAAVTLIRIRTNINKSCTKFQEARLDRFAWFIFMCRKKYLYRPRSISHQPVLNCPLVLLKIGNLLVQAAGHCGLVTLGSTCMDGPIIQMYSKHNETLLIRCLPRSRILWLCWWTTCRIVYCTCIRFPLVVAVANLYGFNTWHCTSDHHALPTREGLEMQLITPTCTTSYVCWCVTATVLTCKPLYLFYVAQPIYPDF